MKYLRRTDIAFCVLHTVENHVKNATGIVTSLKDMLVGMPLITFLFYFCFITVIFKSR
jgi:hypothetical protein